MSIQGAAGAKAAANEIIVFVEEKMRAHPGETEVLRVLEAVLVKAKGIAEKATGGWY